MSVVELQALLARGTANKMRMASQRFCGRCNGDKLEALPERRGWQGRGIVDKVSAMR